jgi:hypothetical protein
VEEYLLSRSPDKVFVTVYALDWSILIFAIVRCFQGGRRFHLCHVYSPKVRQLQNNNSGGANKEPRVKREDALDLSTNEAKVPADKRLLFGQLVYNYGETVSR